MDATCSIGYYLAYGLFLLLLLRVRLCFCPLSSLGCRPIAAKAERQDRASIRMCVSLGIAKSFLPGPHKLGACKKRA
ncbi:hypothetical protein F4775DRAFT_574866 [Biscogniauxia sp. FL1348]|nr:hypothetical protein F4775DRAFT_574866 [Biscogniauxia sp. FL1348]